MKDTILAILIEHGCDPSPNTDDLAWALSSQLERAKHLASDFAFCAGFVSGASNQKRYDRVIDNIDTNLKSSFEEFIRTPK